MQAAEQLLITEEEYLTVERQQDEKHEWYQGECFAMAGGTRWHNILASRILAELVRHLDGKTCTPYMADLRLRIEAHRHYVYPDVMVICNEALPTLLMTWRMMPRLLLRCFQRERNHTTGDKSFCIISLCRRCGNI
jgi:Uma2 family endonuclease